MAIFQYEVINPIADKKKPHYDIKRGLIIPKPNKLYHYYLECARNNENNFVREYFILLSDIKFDKNCRRCHTDDFGRLTISLHGELKDYVINKCKDFNNIDFEYLESPDNYDVYQID